MRNNELDERIRRENDEDFDFCEDCECENDRRGIRDTDRRRDRDCDDFDWRRRDRDCDDFDWRRRDRDFDCDDFDWRRRDRDCGCDDFDWRRRDRDCDCDEDDRRRRDRDCDCDEDERCRRDRDCECRDKDEDKCDRDKDEDRCRCHEREEGCCRDFDFGRTCCESRARCSDRWDFNEDERFGCNSSDAARSDDSWFDRRETECCRRDRNMCEEERSFCKKLKCRIQVLDFALEDTILFLDTHPCDFEALRYYRIIRRKLERLKRIYEFKCGPLTNEGVDTEFGWEWATCPWPWEGKE